MNSYDRDYIFGFLRERKSCKPETGKYAIVLRDTHLNIVPYLERVLHLRKYEIKHYNRTRAQLFLGYPVVQTSTTILEVHDDSFLNFIQHEDFGSNMLGYHSFLPFIRGVAESSAIVSVESGRPRFELTSFDDRLLNNVINQLAINPVMNGSVSLKGVGKLRVKWTGFDFAALYEYLYADTEDIPLKWLREKMENMMNDWSPSRDLHRICDGCGNSFVVTTNLRRVMDTRCFHCVEWRYYGDVRIGTKLKPQVELILGVEQQT